MVGRYTGFLRGFDGCGQDYVAEVPVNFHVLPQPPQVLHHKDTLDMNRPGNAGGGPRKYPRLKVKSNPSVTIGHALRHSPRMRRQSWAKYRVKDASKGPMVLEIRARGYALTACPPAEAGRITCWRPTT